MTTDIALLVNPIAGNGRGARAGRLAAQTLRALGHRVREIVGLDPDDVGERAATAVADGADSVVVVGGDGTVHLAVQRLAGSDVPMGVIPAGAGNDVARYLGLPRADPAAAAAVVADGRLRRMDLARAGASYYLTVLASGFDARVNARANSLSWARRRLRYNIATALELRSFEPIRYSLELDGLRRQVDAMLVAVGNGPSYGGGLRICEGAKLDDGYLDVVLFQPLGRAELMRVFPRLYTGTHVTHPRYEHHRVRRVSLAAAGVTAYADGERIGMLPLTVEAAPGALTVFVPSGTARSLGS